MPLKRFKKPPGKGKHDETKNQVFKLKSEVEVASKEPLSELDKEIFFIQITESEGRLKRRMHVCSHMEEEVSVCKTLYSGKLFLKSESMRLLNEAFVDFLSQTSLLDEEYKAMESLYTSLTQRRHFCTQYQKQVDRLNALRAQLEMKLLEFEKCFDELPTFKKLFIMLKETVSTSKETHDSQKAEVWRTFDACLMRIQNEVCLMNEKVIHDKDLKLHLLPFSWQVLFHSGWLSKSWLKSSVEQITSQSNENMHQQRKCHHFIRLRADDFDVAGNQKRQILLSEKKSPEETDPRLSQQCHHYLQTEVLHQQNKIESMKSEIIDLENAIRCLEISGETYFEKSYLLQIMHKAGSLLKLEFETQPDISFI